ncbi:MAG: UvrD-helicase domain-containing protein [Oscillospiraceae bacterium]|jgi:DNA helicase-2/ATP-dependent DNA helicase PcrA|nr:UvrD-helicase domain-containing protein [Oscillospiraceae bacterium]
MTERKKEKFLSLRKKIIENDFKKMNPMQMKAIMCVKGPLLVLAGAGSGKTTAIVNRIANMMRYGEAYHSEEISSFITEDYVKKLELDYVNGELSEEEKINLSVNPIEPSKILAITFTNKAAGELKSRLGKFLEKDEQKVKAGTFHAICAQILRQFGEKIGYSKHFSLYDADDVRGIIKDCQKALNIDGKALPYRAIMAEISRAKDQMMNYKEYENAVSNDFKKAEIAKVYKLYQEKMHEAGSMDFDDLLMNTVLLFRKCQDVLEYYQDKFEYILVDEYQDTNTVQCEFINLLAQKHKNLCVVGDDDQSIYRFRGANIENILNFEQIYPSTKVIRLEQNYRSTSNIIKAANAVIENNTSRKGKKLWTDNKPGCKIKVHTARDEIDEAKYIADRIFESVSSGKKNYSDFAVLYRMNSQSNILERAFVRSGVPYRIVGGFRFYERKEIKDMIAYLSVINNPKDEVRLRRIINRPKRAIGEKTILRVMDILQETGRDLFDILKNASEYAQLQRVSAKLSTFTGLIDYFIEKCEGQQITISELYQLILKKTDYINALTAECDDSESRIQNINELATNIKIYEKEYQEKATLSGFLEEVALMTDMDEYDLNEQAVTLMTIHAAKGLEFPIVFLPGMEEGVFPGGQMISRPSDIEEERRLAYVAITRAKEQLCIVNTESRMLFGIISHNKPSRFSMEIPKNLAEFSAVRNIKKLERGECFSKTYFEEKLRLIESARSFTQVGGGNAPECFISFNIGDSVAHKVFGTGKVLSTRQVGNDFLLEINFGQMGTKRLMSSFSNLEKINS